MRIVVISDWFSESMGYAENCLPKALAALGHDVHVVTSNAQVYFDHPSYKVTYEKFLGPPLVPVGVTDLNGYTLHRLPHAGYWQGRLRIPGLRQTLRALRPDVVQTFDVAALTTIQAALLKPFLHFQLFTANHVLMSVFPLAKKSWRMAPGQRLAWLLKWQIPGQFVSAVSEKCYPATVDAADIAIRFLGVPQSKAATDPLGVDTDLFKPSQGEALRLERSQLRARLGFGESDVVCIYTGRFTEEKNPLCLARAISQLTGEGAPFRALFLGAGPQADAIGASAGCVLHPFVPNPELPAFYRAADIGVWPKQESTSMLDASACGLPIVISHKVLALDRVEGNAVTYQENEVASMVETLRALAASDVRTAMGAVGAAKILRNSSWLSIAQRRVRDYQAALDNR